MAMSGGNNGMPISEAVLAVSGCLAVPSTTAKAEPPGAVLLALPRAAGPFYLKCGFLSTMEPLSWIICICF